MNGIVFVAYQIWTWLLAHPYVLAGAGYVLINVMPRSWVNSSNPVVRLVAHLVERLCLLSWDRWGGSLKALGVVYPSVPGPNPIATAAAVSATVLGLAMGMSATAVGCLPARVVTAVQNVLDDAAITAEILDSAWQAFSRAVPMSADRYAKDYNTAKARFWSALRASRAATDAASKDATAKELRAAYDALEALLLQCGALHNGQSGVLACDAASGCYASPEAPERPRF